VGCGKTTTLELNKREQKTPLIVRREWKKARLKKSQSAVRRIRAQKCQNSKKKKKRTGSKGGGIAGIQNRQNGTQNFEKGNSKRGESRGPTRGEPQKGKAVGA